MEIIQNISEVRLWCAKQKSVAFVPTMGNLHEGHLRLIDEAKKCADSVIVSIFVNPIQFGQGEDYQSYPRTMEEDVQKLISKKVDTLFVPTVEELYPHVTQSFQVEPSAIQNELCGAFRPGHFRGVATVVAKLFNIVQPDFACFGKKDFQQLFIIKKMVEELNFPVKVIPVDTGRAEDGLALSSRNGYLTNSERQKAPHLFCELNKIKTSIENGERNYTELAQQATHRLTEQGWEVDYVEIRSAETLNIAQDNDHKLVILGAARLGKPRLIDNIEVSLS